MKWIESAKKENEMNREVLSFEEYNDEFMKSPVRESRSTSIYLADMMNHFGKTKDDQFNLITMNHPDAPPVYGQSRIFQAIYNNLLNFQEEGFNSKFILLVGPNGSSKSSILRKIMKGAEEYSKKEEGALYTFSWVFPVDSFAKGKLGLSADEDTKTKKLKTYAYLEENEVSAIINSDLKDHPLLLIPKKYRQEILKKELSKKRPEHFEKIKKSYIYQGDLSKRNRMIYDALLKSYKGDHEEVLKHIRVERWVVSRRYSTGAVTIEPQMHVDAKLQQITMDKRLASLPASLQSLNLFSIQGEVILANRGILEYSDLLKRPIDAFKYLLTSMETSRVNLGGILTSLDVFFVGTSNEVHLDAFKQHPDFKSFKGRFNFLTVPYLLSYLEEKKIYQEQIDGLHYKSHFEPHSLDLLCMFSVMTRLRSPQGKNCTDTKIKNIITGINPLEKAILYATGKTPERLDIESKQILEQATEDIKSEFERDPGYEGRFGLSPRDTKKLIYKLTAQTKNVTYIDVLDHLKKFITRKVEYDFLNMPAQGDFHNPERFIYLLEGYGITKFDRELRDCLGLVDNRSYEEYIRRYIQNINALIKKEKVKNEITGKYEEGDSYFVDEFEKNITLNEGGDNFRSQLISKLGAHFLDNPDSTIIYTDVFPDLVGKLKESFKGEQNKLITAITTNMMYYEAEINCHNGQSKKDIKTPLSNENRKIIKTVLDNLNTRYDYSLNGAIAALKHLLKAND
ncbi:MAG: hypothetical protein KAG61_05920 [Bacteriovoracaceae bacterium]|nr:hypothetical protein [Bacteriovoracaceae bacterium]